MKRFFLISVCVALSMLMPLSSWSQEDYAVVKDWTITFYYDNNKATRDGKIYDVTNELKNGPSWKNDFFSTAVFDESFSNYAPSTAASWFNGCSFLTEVKGLSNLNLSAATNMSYMFASCSGLEKLDLSGLSTGNVKDMQWMFFRCSSLKEIRLDGFNTESVENMNQMFSQCSSLEQLDLSSFNTSNVEDMTKMFVNCLKLQTIYVGDGWTTLYVGASSDMFMGCINLVGGNGTKCDGFGFINPIDGTYARVDTSDKPGYFTYKGSSVTEAYAVVDDNTLTFYYDGEKALRSGNVYDIATEYVGDGNFPAWQSSEITKVSFDSSFSSYLPTSTARWFHSCSRITEIENIDNLNTSEVTNMSGMFYRCNSLKSLNLNSFNTGKVTNMYAMFYECSSLSILDLSSFDTGKVTSMVAMFYGCTGLNELNLWGFKTKNVEDMQYMFFNCSSLTTLDLSCFNTAKVENMDAMFAQCSNIITIFASEFWSIDKVLSGDYMFYGCNKLVGGNGTKVVYITNYMYAKIDEEDSPGYFTYKNPCGIDDIKNIRENKICQWFMIDGTQHSTPKKGINILNGKKVLIK